MAQQGKFWLLTIPHADFLPYLPNVCVYIRGQLESGGTTGYLHWQVLVMFSRKRRLGFVRETFGDRGHYEYARSEAARAYVWKDDTAVIGTRFELGDIPVTRDADGWNQIRQYAKSGDFESIPADIYVRCYGQLKSIAKDNLGPVGMQRRVYCFFGRTGTGKSRRAWDEAGIDAYPKDPMSKFWDGYRNQSKVVIDEFRGGISISHVLRWFDRYPVIVEAKHGAVVLLADTIWITSNVSPRLWYPDLDEETVEALLRRLEITEFVM